MATKTVGPDLGSSLKGSSDGGGDDPPICFLVWSATSSAGVSNQDSTLHRHRVSGWRGREGQQELVSSCEEYWNIGGGSKGQGGEAE